MNITSTKPSAAAVAASPAAAAAGAAAAEAGTAGTAALSVVSGTETSTESTTTTIERVGGSKEEGIPLDKSVVKTSQWSISDFLIQTIPHPALFSLMRF